MRVAIERPVYEKLKMIKEALQKDAEELTKVRTHVTFSDVIKLLIEESPFSEEEE